MRAAGCVDVPFASERSGILVNDVQSQLNATRVARIVQPKSLEEIAAAVRHARIQGRPICVAGGRHAMGTQQFGTNALLLDMTSFCRVRSFDRVCGLVEVEAGIEWPELIAHLNREQAGESEQWGIRQKQTGVDDVTLGGSLAANIHGRGLTFPPIVSEVESFRLIDAEGKLHDCSRQENAELFALAIGGYGLFGIITHITLRLVRRTKLERMVDIIPVAGLLDHLDRSLADGCLYGDCQYATDLACDAIEHPGVFARYRPVPDTTPITNDQKQLHPDDWAALYRLARTDKQRAFETYSRYYLSTSRQIYWSDTHQLAGHFSAHRNAVDARQGTEMITEVYVSRESLLDFMAATRRDFVERGVDMTYGTIRFIQRDDDTFLPWARESFVCIVCNLHVRNSREGRRKAAADFRRILDRAIEFGGGYYLTYHRWATRRHVEGCYPQFVEWLKLKRKYDPHERFQSDWYRHYVQMFTDRL